MMMSFSPCKRGLLVRLNRSNFVIPLVPPAELRVLVVDFGRRAEKEKRGQLLLIRRRRRPLVDAGLDFYLWCKPCADVGH